MKRVWTIENTETCQYLDRMFHRVVLTEDCQFGKKGDKMGWIEKEENLQDDAMVFDEAVIFDKAVVCENAKVYNYSMVFNNAIVSGNAEIRDEAIVSGSAKIYGDARIYGKAQVYDSALVYGNAQVLGNARIYGNATICGNAEIYSNKDYIVFKNWWSSGRYFTYLRNIDMYVVGCFQGTGKELISKAYKNSKESGRNYEKIVKYVESTKKELNKEYKNTSFIKWLFKGIDKSLLFGIIAMVFGISGVLLHGKTYVANIASVIGIIAIVLMVNESLIQFKKTIKNEK